MRARRGVGRVIKKNGAERLDRPLRLAAGLLAGVPGASLGNRHTPEEIGIDSFQADRSPDGRYRTTPLKGLSAHMKGGFYHDGRFATLRDVVDHYDGHFNLRLTEQKKNNLVEFLKSL